MTLENPSDQRQLDLNQCLPKPVFSLNRSHFQVRAEQTCNLTPNPSSRKRGYELNHQENVVPVNVEEVLKRLMTLPITSWNEKDDNPTVRHMGPMAQDVAAAFGLENQEQSIYAIDINGIALAAIQALYQRLQQKDAEIAELQANVNRLNQEFLERKLLISDAIAVLMA
jgi:hypothetical protein